MIERILPLAASLLARTLRIRWSGETLPERAVIMFWHGKMFAGWYSVRKRKPVALVSNSKDGKLLASVLSGWRYRLVRGSSGKNGMEALNEAIESIRSGDSNALVITPDGPRGPYHIFKRGGFIAANELGLPLYMLHIRYHRRRQFLKSWDKFELPLPFSTVDIVVEKVDVINFVVDGVEAQKAWLENVSSRFSDG